MILIAPASAPVPRQTWLPMLRRPALRRGLWELLASVVKRTMSHVNGMQFMNISFIKHVKTGCEREFFLLFETCHGIQYHIC